MNGNGVETVVWFGDAITFRSDALVLKYSQRLYGLDQKVVATLTSHGIDVSRHLPVPGNYYPVFNTHTFMGPKAVFFVGTPELRQFQYKEIRTFAQDSLSSVTESNFQPTTISVTMHGAGYGLDEEEAFSSQLAGFVDAITSGEAPSTLDQIVFVEFDRRRASMMSEVLRKTIPDGIIKRDPKKFYSTVTESSQRALREVGYSSDSKEHIFVAMPFKDEMEDIWDYGIKPVVKDAGYVCERADLSSYTGDVMDWVRKRIKTAEIVIADLTTSNPNVYLEVGYAWGVGIPTILISRCESDLKFDVRGQRCLIYGRIKDLEKKLRSELENLKKQR